MIKHKIITALLLGPFFFLSFAVAGDFGWMDKLNKQAKENSSDFIVKLAARFNIGDVQVKAVLNDVTKLSDAYMVFRLGELSDRPTREVLDVYHGNRNKGWGFMAKQLGIKPGSREFHALKRGHDLDNPKSRNGDHPSDKGNKHKNKGKGKYK